MTCIAEFETRSTQQLELFTTWFAQRANAHPDRIALEFEGNQWSYLDVHQCSNQVARFLIERGFQPEDRIGICMERSALTIIVMLGILKSGCAFVPLDPEFPSDRLTYILEDAEIRFAFCEKDFRDCFEESVKKQVEFMEPEDTRIWTQEDSELELVIPLNSLAYVMYTSGSTGKPKGVQIEHASLSTYCLADIDVYQLQPNDRTLQFSTLNFDIAIEEIYPPLLVGSTVVVRPRERAVASNELSTLIDNHHITALHIATAYWNEWIDLLVATQARVPSSLRLVIATGEKISTEHYRRWKSLCDHEVLWCNAYGPTETTVTCTVFVPHRDWDEPQMPIGKPLKGYTAHILDEEYRPVATGETGQLFIGGPALARGYLHRPELTAKAFLEVQLPNSEKPTRIYRTGDLARWLPSGDIEFAGRVDHQMKIGSYRIEPGEIEVVLLQHPGIREALVTCVEHAHQKSLVAFVVRNDASVSTQDTATFLRGRLPAYMVPSRYVFLDALPKTINGKIDRAALPSIDVAETVHSSNYEELQSELERELASIWTEVLRVPNIGRHDDFFQLGGSSLLVTRVIAQIAGKLQRTIPVRDFFANPTIASLVALWTTLDESNPEKTQAIRSQSQKLRQRLPKIEPCRIESGRESLAGFLYPACSQLTTPLRKSVLLCHAHGHEYSRAHRNLQQLAVQLAQDGLDVLRFDYSCTGDSSGDDEHATLEQWQLDIQSAHRFLRNRFPQNTISWIGVRLGATLAASVVDSEVDQLLLWDPVANGQTYLQLLRHFHSLELSSLTRYPTVRTSPTSQWMGYYMGESFERSLRELKLELHRLQSASSPRLLLSKNFKQDESLLSIPTNVTVQETQDQIHWHQHPFVDRAFSAPEIANAIRSFLSRGTK